MPSRITFLLLVDATALASVRPVPAAAQGSQFYISPMVSQIDDNSEKGYEDDSGRTFGFGAEFRPGWNL